MKKGIKKIKKPKIVAFRPYREGQLNKPEIKKEYKKPLFYKINGERVDVFYWVRWPGYDFVFGKPAKDSRYYGIEEGFFQYRNKIKKKIVCGFYVDKKELEELIVGFSRLKSYSNPHKEKDSEEGL